MVSPAFIVGLVLIVGLAVLEVEVSVGVVVGDVLDHLVDELHLALRKLSVLDILSEKVAEDSAEVLMTWVRQEAACVCEHSYEAAEKAQ